MSFSENSAKRPIRGKENLHTKLFRALMREDKLCNTIDIGTGEIFFRDSVIKKPVVHKVGEKMVNRIFKDEDKSIPSNIYRELYQFANGKLKVESLSKDTKYYITSEGKINEEKVVVKDVKHEIVKDRRFTVPKYQFHLSTILNFGKKDKVINSIINESFDNALYLGIDRGEKHLVYYSLINSKGEILGQGHFDTIRSKDYLEVINEAVRVRRERQENWQQRGNISNLKDGYVSLVVHEIMEKLKDENGNYRPTFIVLEKLNKGFKNSRKKFEQEVYQKFELALAKKLNYLVDKSKNDGELGSIAKALQLTPPISNFQDIEKAKGQVGIMLYTNPKYTSVTDPITGWRQSIYIQKGKEEKIKEQVLAKFSDIKFDGKDYCFEYIEAHSGKAWTLYSSKYGVELERYRSHRGKAKNEYIIEQYKPKELLDQLFDGFDKSRSLLAQIEDGVGLKKIDKEKPVWESLRFVIALIQQIRNNGTTQEDDNFLLSPVRDEDGNHFDSRIAKECNLNLPQDADANGAYNIARKGMLMHEHIKYCKESNKYDKLDLFITDEEWDMWLADQESWERKLDEFAVQKDTGKKDDEEDNID